MRIFYVTDGVFIAGGQMINLEHVAALRRLGFDARFLVIRPPEETGFQPDLPADVPWQFKADLTAEDWVVCGEMHANGLLAVMDSPARKAIHNQNWHYSFQAFLDVPSVRRWGCEAIIAGSRIGAQKIAQMGWTDPIPAVRVFVDPVFFDAPSSRALKVCCMTRKRALEARLIRGTLVSRHPEHADVPWLEIAGVSRAQAAAMLKSCEVFLSLSEKEGLGLPPLEAMAGGSLVIGYHGVGGLEYATQSNGDWFDDAASHVEIADRLAERLAALKAGDAFDVRRQAGVATARSFSRAQFEAELKAAWDQILSR